MNKKWLRMVLLLVTVILVVGLVAFSCAAPPTEGPPTEGPPEEGPPEEGPPPPKTLKMGAHMALSGPAGGWGIPIANGLILETEKINNEGGIQIGGETYLIEMICEDNEYSPEGATTASRKLVERDKVKVIFGGVVTHDTLPMLPMTTPEKIITGCTCYSGEVLTAETNAPYHFKTSVSPHEAQAPMYDWAFARYPEIQKVAEITANTMSGIYGQEMSIGYLESIGKEIVANEYYEFGVTDFYPFLTRMLAGEPDLIHSTAATPADWALIMKQSRELGYEGYFLQEIPASPYTIEVAGVENIEGLITVAHPSFGELGTPEYADFIARYEEAYGAWDLLGAWQVPFFHMVVGAYQMAGTVDDPDRVVELLETETFYPLGIEGRCGDGGGLYDQPHQVGFTLYIVEIRNGELDPVGVITVADQIDRTW